jgi:predicted enzyme related to lactoylglutathione lyase
MIWEVKRILDHTIVHFEIPAENVDKLKSFYEKVFGWNILQLPGPLDYWEIQTVPMDPNGAPLRPGVNGGLYKKQTLDNKPLNYYSVESITEFLDKVVKAGGKVVQPKEEVPEIGWVAAAEDPEGNPFALIELMRIK